MKLVSQRIIYGSYFIVSTITYGQLARRSSNWRIDLIGYDSCKTDQSNYRAINRSKAILANKYNFRLEEWSNARV